MISKTMYDGLVIDLVAPYVGKEFTVKRINKNDMGTDIQNSIKRETGLNIGLTKANVYKFADIMFGEFLTTNHDYNVKIIEIKDHTIKYTIKKKRG